MEGWTTLLVSALTFVIGLLCGMFFKYGDITTLKTEMKTVKESLSVVNVAEIIATLKSMKESVIFTPDFQSKITAVCSEHDRLREQSAKNSDDIITLQEQIKHSRNIGINVNKD
jgi:hypothetical protein